jgi:type I restriction enzyme S subunit
VSRIDDLIAEACPEGVPLKPLGEVGAFIRGNGLQKSDLGEVGMPAIHYGQIHTHYGIWATHAKSFVSEQLGSKLRKAQPGDLVIATTSEDDDAVAKAVAWLGVSEAAVSGDAYIFRHGLDPKFVSYYFNTESFRAQKQKYVNGTKVRRISGESLAKISIPTPALEVQREIVKVLDLFAALGAALGAALEAEQEARRRQYKHYRDSLLSFTEDVGWVTLGELATNHDSRRRPVTKSARRPGDVPYYGASGVVDYVSGYIFDGDFLLVSEDGANLLARTTPIAFSVSGKSWVNNHAHVLEFPTYVQRRFVEIYLNSVDLSPFIGKAAQPKLNQANLNRIPVPAPGLEEQAQIVSTLDKLDSLVNDLSVRLPAELKARRLQYEYYRDKLLAFEEAVA